MTKERLTAPSYINTPKNRIFKGNGEPVYGNCAG